MVQLINSNGVLSYAITKKKARLIISVFWVYFHVGPDIRMFLCYWTGKCILRSMIMQKAVFIPIFLIMLPNLISANSVTDSSASTEAGHQLVTNFIESQGVSDQALLTAVRKVPIHSYGASRDSGFNRRPGVDFLDAGNFWRPDFGGE